MPRPASTLAGRVALAGLGGLAVVVLVYLVLIHRELRALANQEGDDAAQNEAINTLGQQVHDLTDKTNTHGRLILELREAIR